MIVEQRRHVEVRDLAEEVLQRAELLDAADRALIEQVLGKGVLPREVAVVTGVSTRCIQRRFRSLIQRLSDPKVLHIMRHRKQWDKLTADVATGVWIKGWSLRHTASQLGVSLHRIRQRVQTVRGILTAVDTPEPGARRAR
ncbi:MAG: hypothetical protein WD294_10565 [Phycisphaeraceae bacterium]